MFYIIRVDALLDELASLSRWSSGKPATTNRLNLATLTFDATVEKKAGAPRRSRAKILHELYYRLSASEAGFMTQIILRDLTPSTSLVESRSRIV